jgi:hypothetical protein
VTSRPSSRVVTAVIIHKSILIIVDAIAWNLGCIDEKFSGEFRFGKIEAIINYCDNNRITPHRIAPRS